MKSVLQFFNSLKRDTAGKRYIPFVDGIRFLAIMPVVILHGNERLLRYVIGEASLTAWESELSYVISRGAIGVMIFFALSGFILSLPFAKQHTAFRYKTYLTRRLTRLEPPYIFWTTVFALVFIIRNQLSVIDISGNYLASIFYVHNFVFGEFSPINPVAWSLEVEIQYYILAPFLAKAYFSQPDPKSRRALLLCLTALFVIYQHVFGWQLLPFRASILGQLQHFLVGMLMADLYVYAPKWHKKKSLRWDLLGLISFVTLMFTWTEELGKSLIFILAMIGFFSATLKGKILHSMLNLKWLTIIGGMCYTIYLTHLPLTELIYSLIGKIGYSSPYWLHLTISLIITLPLVLLSSMIFFKCIEQPFMKKDSLKQLSRLFQGSLPLKRRSITKTH